MVFDKLYDAIVNNVLYELARNWSHLNKCRVPENYDFLPKLFATLPNAFVCELGMMRPEAPAV